MPWSKATLRERVYFSWHFRIILHYQRKSEHTPGVRRWCRGRMLLTGLFPMASSRHLTRDSTTISGLDPPTSVIKQENAPQVYLPAHLVGTFSQLGFLFPRWLGFCQIDINLARTKISLHCVLVYLVSRRKYAPILMFVSCDAVCFVSVRPLYCILINSGWWLHVIVY